MTRHAGDRAAPSTGPRPPVVRTSNGADMPDYPLVPPIPLTPFELLEAAECAEDIHNWYLALRDSLRERRGEWCWICGPLGWPTPLWINWLQRNQEHGIGYGGWITTQFYVDGNTNPERPTTWRVMARYQFSDTAFNRWPPSLDQPPERP